jgi:hypothetical protein
MDWASSTIYAQPEQPVLRTPRRKPTPPSLFMKLRTRWVAAGVKLIAMALSLVPANVN